MDAHVYRRWNSTPGLLEIVRGLFSYGVGDDRATGYLYGDGQAWPPVLALLGALKDTLSVEFTHVAFQAYRNGAGCDWHTDAAWDAQAILSLGDTRTFGIRPVGRGPEWLQVHHGDVLFMPSGFQAEWEHCVPVEDVEGERISLVFRTVARG